MRKGRDLVQGVATELLTDHLQLILKTSLAKGDLCFALLHQGHERQARGLGIALFAQEAHFSVHQSTRVILREPDVLKAHNFALVHLDPAVDLPEVFAKRDLVNKLFHCAKLAIGLQTFGPFLHLAQAFNIRGQPSEPVRGCLVLFQELRRYAAFRAHICAYALNGLCQERLGWGNCRACQSQQIGKKRILSHCHMSVHE